MFCGAPDVHPRAAALMRREQWVQRTPEWHEARRDLLTASDAAAALGVKPFKSYRGDTRAELVRKKVTNEFVNNMFVVHGQKYEDEARDMAMAALGERAEDVGLVRHAHLPWLGASPDGVTSAGRLVEIKCPLKRTIVPGEVPEHYMPQIQVQMEVCDVDATLFVQYKPPAFTTDGRPFLDIVVVERDRLWFADHKDALHACWLDFMSARAAAASLPPPPPPLPPANACLVNYDLYAEHDHAEHAHDHSAHSTPPT